MDISLTNMISDETQRFMSDTIIEFNPNSGLKHEEQLVHSMVDINVYQLNIS